MSDEEELDYNFGALQTFLGNDSDDEQVRIKKEESGRLPIKVNGRLVFQPEAKAPKPKPKKVIEKVVEEVPAANEKTEKQKPKKPKTLTQIKNELAELATLILEDPSANIKSLSKLHLGTNRDDGIQLQIFTQLRVYLDLIPLYRIVAYPESMESLSKQVKQQRSFEQTLLKSYQSYLLFLEKLVKGNKPSGVKRAAFKCFCGLLEKVYFNYGKNVMAMVVEGLVSNDSDISELCASSLEVAFAQPLDAITKGEWILDGVKMLVDKVKKLNHDVTSTALRPLLALRIDLDEKKHDSAFQKKKEVDENGKRKREHLSKQQRKKRKVLKEVEKEMMEAESEISKEERQKQATEMVTIVMACYVRVLKLKPKARCLEMVLKGIVKFMKYVNIDMTGDVVRCLKTVAGILEESDDQSNRWNNSRALKCLVTGLEVIESTQGVLELDMTDYYDSIFRLSWGCIRGFDNSQVADSDLRYFLRAIEFLLVKHRKTPIERVSAFTKRMLILACALPVEYSVETLKTVMRALQRGLEGLESEDGWHGVGTSLIGGSKGVIAELSREKPVGVGTSIGMWEFVLLSQHYHPAIRVFANHLIEKKDTVNGLDGQRVLKESSDTWSIRKDGFSITPAISIPSSIKKKTIKSDGPVKFGESDFMASLLSIVE